MYNLLITPKDRVKKHTLILDRVSTEQQAIKFCEQWGWSYDDGQQSYWLDYKEIKEVEKNED